MGLEPGATLQKVNVRYRFLDRLLHSDKHNPEVTVMMSEEAVGLFKLVNNTQHFLRDTIRK